MLRPRNKKKQSGQALVEFLLFAPLLILLVWYLVKANMAINVGIVGQKHARSQVFLKMFNHMGGPAKGVPGIQDFVSMDRSAFFIGVSGTVVTGPGDYPAPVVANGQGINPTADPTASDDPGEAPVGASRQKIRVRTAFGICTHRKFNEQTKSLRTFCGT